MPRAPTPPQLLGQGGTALPFADATDQHHRLASRQPTAGKHRPAIEVVDPGAGLTAVIDQAPFGVTKHARLLDTALTGGTAKALRVKILGAPLTTAGILQ